MSDQEKTLLTQKKKRGPKPTGKGSLIGTRLQPGLLERLDEWRGNLTRPEAIRRLIEAGLSSEAK